uniref:EamA domain-containing membrane protein RarD n=1 Tax=uncultured Thiotrichaceae bacterium TaxID=298394 RepID=A0A6S6UMW2_9GAMM|nr:MAG: EamA domain-containing membrane protein RarD [uncultured Thiotrichaceae bacterium]
MHEHNKGILLMIATTILFASQDTITKFLGQTIPIFQFVGIRYLAFFLFAVWFATRKRSLKEVLKVNNVWLQLLRGAMLGIQIVVFAYVIRELGVGEMQSIFMAYPLIVTALSASVLGEAVGWRRWAAVCIGFVGTLIIIAPGSASFSVYSLFALGLALMIAIYTLLTRLVSRTDSTDSSLLYTAMIGALVTVPFMPAVWQPLTMEQSALVGVLCLTGASSHYFMILALKFTPAVILQPFNYLVLPWAIFLGYLVFDEVIPLHKWYGIALVIGAGLFIALRQRQIKGL